MASERYVATGLSAAIAASPGKTALNVIGGTGVRPSIYFVDLSIDGTPADVMIRMQVMRTSAVGTAGSAVTPAQLDGSGIAAEATAGETHSAEPTYTAATELIDVDRHFRAPLQFQAVDQLAGFQIPASANAGVGFRAFHASSTPFLNATAHWSE
jgi:hypothetical protein